jgi:MFS family permease
MTATDQAPPRRTLPIISAVTFAGFLDTTLLVPVMAIYAKDLGAGVGIAGLIIGLYSITNTPANVLFGGLIDRIGHRIPLVIGLAGDAVSMLLYSVSGSPLHLALVRIFHGVSGAAVGPATMSAIAGYSSQRREGRAMGIYGMSIAAANLIGFALGGMMASRVGFRALFYLGAGVLATGAGLGAWLPKVPRPEPKETAVPPAGHFDTVKRLLRRRGLVVAYVAIFAQYFSFGGVVTLLPSYIEDFGLEAFHMGMMLTAFSVLFIVVLFPAGAYSDRRGRRLPTISGLALGIVALLLLTSQSSFGTLVAVMALYGVAYGLLFPSVSAMVADNSHADERGVATGLFHALLTAGVAIGAPVLGWMGELLGIRSGLLLTPVMTTVALATALALLTRD